MSRPRRPWRLFTFSAAVASAAKKPAGPSPPAWRAAEEVEGLPVGAEVILTGDEILTGNRGIAYRNESRVPYHIELVHEDDLPSFLQRRLPVESSSATSQDFKLTPETCRSGRFLLSDPRMGMLNNQRRAYETALDMASALGRILVMPGFFKFPHPQAYAGTQWVPFRELFDLEAIRRCYGRVVEVEELVKTCGPEVLDNHVTVPFEELWARSKRKAPWLNGTRPDMIWADSDGKVFRFTSRAAGPELWLKVEERRGYVLAAFLRPEAAEARTVRAHGLLASNSTIGDVADCILPSKETLALAHRVASRAGLLEGGNETPRVLAMHVRVFKWSTSTSGGHLIPELADMQEYLCNIEPEVYAVIASWTLVRTFKGFWPTHTWLASNEADISVLGEYAGGLPGVRVNPYRPSHHDAAVTAEECTLALRSVLVDTIISAWADFFIGNVCSTMTQYILQLRLRYGKSFASSLALGGVQHVDLLRSARRNVAEAYGTAQ